MFRVETEVRLKKKSCTEQDRKYMVQTLTTVMMTYVQRPSLNDCQVVSAALHKKFKFLGGESSEVNKLPFLYFNSAVLYYRVLGNGSCTQEVTI